MKLSGTHQLLVYTDDVNILGGSVCTIKKNTEALLVSSKVIGPEVNSDKTKYMVMSQNRNAEQSHNIEIDKSSYERAEELKIFGRFCTKRQQAFPDFTMLLISS